MLAIDQNSNTKSRTILINSLAFIYFAILILLMILAPNIWLYSIFVITGLAFIFYSEQLGLNMIILLTMVFERYFTLQSLVIDQTIYKLYPLDILIILTAISFLIHLRLQKRARVQFIWGWPETLLIIFILINLFTFIRSLTDYNVQVDIAFSTLKNYVFYSAIYFLIIYSVQKAKDLKRLIEVILLGGVIIIPFILYGLITGQGLWTEFTPLSTTGLRLLAGTHAFYLCLSSLILLSFLAFKKFANQQIAGLILWIWLLGIAVSLMRHLWLALIVALVILILIIPKEAKKKILNFSAKNILIIFSAIAIILTITSLYPRQQLSANINTTGEYLVTRASSIVNLQEDASAIWRKDLWTIALNSWLKNPMLGTGFGKRVNLQTGDWQNYEELRNLHNSPLAILIQTGLIGFILFIAFIISVLATSFKQIYLNHELTPYYLPIISAGVLFFIASFFQPYLETNLTGIFFWIILGLIRTITVVNKNSIQN
ncbi:MAG: O-antigen ligase family protein [bacterium]